MSRALALSQRQTQALMRAAEAEQGIVEVKVGNAFIRLIPNCHATGHLLSNGKPKSVDTVESPPSPLAQWRDKRDADKARRRAYG